MKRDFKIVVENLEQKTVDRLCDDIQNSASPLDKIFAMGRFIDKEEPTKDVVGEICKNFEISYIDTELLRYLLCIESGGETCRKAFLRTIDFVQENKIKSYIHRAYLLGIMRDETDEKEFNDLMKKGGVVERDAILVERYFLECWDEEKMAITNKVNYKTEGEENMDTVLKEKILIEDSAQHLIGDAGSTILAEAEMWAVKLDDIITILDNSDIFEDEDGDRWIKAGTDIVPLMNVEEEFSVSISLTKDQLDIVYDLFDDDGMLKSEDN